MQPVQRAACAERRQCRLTLGACPAWQAARRVEREQEHGSRLRTARACRQLSNQRHPFVHANSVSEFDLHHGGRTRRRASVKVVTAGLHGVRIIARTALAMQPDTRASRAGDASTRNVSPPDATFRGASGRRWCARWPPSIASPIRSRNVVPSDSQSKRPPSARPRHGLGPGRRLASSLLRARVTSSVRPAKRATSSATIGRERNGAVAECQ